MKQLSIFDFIEDPTTATALDNMSEPDMVEAVKQATGIDFKYRDDLWGYVAKIKDIQYTVHFSNYTMLDNNDRFISCGYGNNKGGAASPCDSLEEAVQFFKTALKRHTGKG